MSFGKSDSTKSGTSNTTDNTNQNSTFDQTTTPNLPDWVSSAAQGLNTTAQGLAGVNPTNYVAQATPLLTTAANSAGDLSGTPWDYDAATNLTSGVANTKAPDIASMMTQFEDPYQQQVVAATNKSLDHSDSLQNEQDDLNMAASGAFGGSGAALTKAATAQAQALARGTTIGNLQTQGFGTALQGATSQAGVDQAQEAQKLAAAAQIANVANDYGANERANITTQDAAAAPIQSISQATATAPLDLQSWLAQMFGSSDPSLFAGSTQAGNENQSGTQTQNGTSTGSASGTTASVNLAALLGLGT